MTRSGDTYSGSLLCNFLIANLIADGNICSAFFCLRFHMKSLLIFICGNFHKLRVIVCSHFHRIIGILSTSTASIGIIIVTIYRCSDILFTAAYHRTGICTESPLHAVSFRVYRKRKLLFPHNILIFISSPSKRKKNICTSSFQILFAFCSKTIFLKFIRGNSPIFISVIPEQTFRVIDFYTGNMYRHTFSPGMFRIPHPDFKFFCQCMALTWQKYLIF